MAAMVGEIGDAVEELQMAVDKEDKRCSTLTDEYTASLSEWQGKVAEYSGKLSEATESLNQNEEGIRLKIEEYHVLDGALREKLDKCKRKIDEGESTLCAIRKVRLELFEMKGSNPFIQDCEVTDWVEEECSVSCGH